MKWFLIFFTTSSLFGLTIQEAEKRALTSSPAVLMGDLQAEQKEAQYAQAFLSWFPEVTFGSMFAVLQKSQKISNFQRQKHLFSNQFTITQPIFSSSLLENLNLARLVKEGGIIGKSVVENDTLLEVRTQFLAFGLKSQASSLGQVKLAYLQQVLKEEEIRLKSGRTTQLQVAKAKAAVSYEIAQQLESRKELMSARHALSLIMHLSPWDEAAFTFGGFPALDEFPLLKQKLSVLQSYLVKNITAVSPPTISLFTEDEIQQFVAEARLNKPELQQLTLYVQAADVKRVQTRTQYLPEVSAFVDYGYYQPVNGQFFRQRNDWAGGIQLSWSLFDSLKKEMKSKEVVALRKAARLGLSYEIDKLEATIRQDLGGIEEALFGYQNAQENLFLAQQALEESEVQLGTGGISDLQLQDAKRFLAECEFNHMRVLAALLQKYYQFQHDLGKKVDYN